MTKFNPLSVVFMILIALSTLVSCGGDELAVNPDLTVPATIVRGKFEPKSATCQTDGSSLEIMQNGESIWLKGGFGYDQKPIPMMGGYECTGYVNSKGNVKFRIKGEAETLDCQAALIDSVFQGTCEQASGAACDFSFKREDSKKEEQEESPSETSGSVGSWCVDSIEPECHIYNSCYDCKAHKLTRSSKKPEACVAETFEKKCRGEIDKIPGSSEKFLPGCVFDVLKSECNKEPLDEFRVCEDSDPQSISGCQVHGYAIDCANYSIWACEGEGMLLPGENENRDPPVTPGATGGGF